MGLETAEEPVVLLDDVDESEVHNEVPIDAFDELLSQQLLQARQENQTQAVPSWQMPSSPHHPLLSESEVSIFAFSMLVGCNEIKQIARKLNFKFILIHSLLSSERFLRYCFHKVNC
jgi:hypothetical protein